MGVTPTKKPKAPKPSKATPADVHAKLVAEVKEHTEQVRLTPTYWKNYTTGHGLKWTLVPFDKPSRSKVPKKPGLYAFAVHPPHSDFPPSVWLFYVGEVGATGSPARTLWVRYAEYLAELENTVRKKVGTFLFRYRGYTSFYYCVLDPATVDIKSVESELISALWPDANITDFDAAVSSIRRAFS